MTGKIVWCVIIAFLATTTVLGALHPAPRPHMAIQNQQPPLLAVWARKVWDGLKQPSCNCCCCGDNKNG
jgi:hypothetical protein